MIGPDDNLYELHGPDFRIAVYYDHSVSKFIMLWGWLKKNRKQSKDIKEARRLLYEYINSKKGK